MRSLPHKLRLSSTSGMSLVEVLVVVLIMMLVSGGIYGVFAAGQESWQVNKTQIEIQQEMRRALDGMIHELRQAGPASITNVPANGTWYTTITFKRPTTVTAGALVWEPNTIQYLLGGTGSTQLQRVQTGTTTKILAQDMQTLQFRRQAATPDTLEVSLVAGKTAYKHGPVSMDFTFDIQLRN